MKTKLAKCVLPIVFVAGILTGMFASKWWWKRKEKKLMVGFAMSSVISSYAPLSQLKKGDPEAAAGLLRAVLGAALEHYDEASLALWGYDLTNHQQFAEARKLHAEMAKRNTEPPVRSDGKPVPQQ